MNIIRRALALALSSAILVTGSEAATLARVAAVRPLAMPAAPMAATASALPAMAPSAALAPASLSAAPAAAPSAESGPAAAASLQAAEKVSVGLADAELSGAESKAAAARAFAQDEIAVTHGEVSFTAGAYGSGAATLAANSKGKDMPDEKVDEVTGRRPRRGNDDRQDPDRRERDYDDGTDNSNYIGPWPLFALAAVAVGVGLVATGGTAAIAATLTAGAAGVQSASLGMLPLAMIGLATVAGVTKPGVPTLDAREQVGASARLAEQPNAAKVFVTFNGPKVVKHDVILSQSGMDSFVGDQQFMLADSAAAGVDAQKMSQLNATPIAAHSLTNTIEYVMDASKVDAFAAEMRAKGHQVDMNDIVVPTPKPIELKPEDLDPNSRGNVSLAENLQIGNAVRVKQVAEEMWGKPGESGLRRFMRGLGRRLSAPPAMPQAISDTGADIKHPLLKALKETVLYYPTDAVGDKNGHGSHTNSTYAYFNPWALPFMTHHKIFNDNGGATREAIMNHFTNLRKSKAVLLSASWGNNFGDPNDITAKAAKELAAEGHILIFAAGNNGRAGKNTIGGPAIAYYKDPASGAVRVISIAATDRGMKVTGFSSKGPRSPATKDQADYPSKPEAAYVGLNTEAAWPLDMTPDRVDGENGPVKAISGTSMATPGFAGAVSLLMMMFGVVETGEKADAVINAVMSTLKKTGLNDRDAEGEGFLDLEAAYEKLFKQFYPGQVPPTQVIRMRELQNRRAELLRWMSVRGASASDVGRYMSEEHAINEQIAALRAEHAGIDKAQIGFVGEMMGRTFKSPVEPAAAEYAALKKELSSLKQQQQGIYAESLRHNAKLGNELLELSESRIDPRMAVIRARLAQLEAANPGLVKKSLGARILSALGLS